MTKTVKEKYAEIAQAVESNLSVQTEFEGFVTNDLKRVEELASRFTSERQKQRPVTVQEAEVLSLYVRQAIKGNETNAAGIHWLMLLISDLARLAQIDVDMNLNVPANIENELGAWFKERERAKNAYKEYIQ